MKKYILLVIVLLLISFVSAAPVLNVDKSSISILGPEDSQRSDTFTIKNDGDTVLNNIVFTNNVKLTDGTNTINLVFNPSSIATLAIGASQAVTLTANIPDKMKMGVYSGTVNVSSGSVQDTFTLDMTVTPELCTEGQVGGDLSFSIEDLDEGDGFKPGEEISFSVNVENSGTDDQDVIVKAYLYNMDSGKKIAAVESDKKEVKEDDESNFDLVLAVPTDTKYLKEGDKYSVFVKIFESGNEDENCKEDYINLDLELEEQKAVIESVAFSPSTVSCGDRVTAAVKVRSIGTDDLDDVRVQVTNSELGINQVSEFFDLSGYDETDDNNQMAQVTFQIPEDAEEKTYDFLSIEVLYDGGSSDVTEILSNNIPKLVVSGCGANAGTNLISTLGTQANLAASPSQSSVAVGSSLLINYVLTNPTNSTASYTIDFVPNGNWANSVSQTISVNAGQAYSGVINTLTNTVAQSTYSGVLSVKSGSAVLDSKTITIDLLNPNQITGGATFTEKSLFDDLRIGNIPVAFWVIADLILAFIILALVYIVYRR